MAQSGFYSLRMKKSAFRRTLLINKDMQPPNPSSYKRLGGSKFGNIVKHDNKNKDGHFFLVK